ncbi:MAG: hypothetical protein KAR42_09345 [candidate division Zixibacteria bacterium]|nr:hypothetical protein [candidate division Zixibacteria bacterium]
MINTGKYTLNINDRVKFKTGWLRKEELIYAGMPNEHTVSLTFTWSYAHNSMAYSIFVPITQREIRHMDFDITISRVTPTTIDVEISHR